MFAFRKFFLALALVATFGTIASAQGPVNCVANSGVPPLLRAEGLAELVGDVLIVCQGGDPGETRLVNFDIFLNTNVTSDLVATNSLLTEALLLVDEPSPSEQNTTGFQAEGSTLTPGGDGRTTAIYQGSRTVGFENRLTWNGVSFIPPGTNNVRRFRFTNVRANATQLPTGQFVPSSVSMFINVSPQNSLPLQNPQQIVGTILPSLRVGVTPASFKRCETPADKFSVTLTELFATAFKKRIETDTNEFGAPVRQNNPGIIYHTESGFIPANQVPTSLSSAGVADTGTRFVISVKGVASGISFTAPSVIGITTAGTTDFGLARVTGFNADFSGGSLATPGTADTAVGLTAGAGTVVYEVVGDPGTNRSSFLDSFTINFTTAFGTTVGLGDATVAVSYGPINETATMNFTAPEPRFTNRDAGNNNIFGVRACRTLILWPFVSNQAGFDSGLAISNTSTDPFGTTPQTGPCTLYYYGNTNGTGAAPAAQTSASIPSGDHMVATLSSGGKFGIKETPGFQGYVIGVCEFQYAHAYGFISDLGAQRLAQGYLALIIPDKTATTTLSVRRAEAFSLNAASNQGEQLVH